jgi:hypothetical protein
MEGAEVTTGGAALSPLPLGGRRRSHKKLRLVKKKTVRKMLKKMGLKLRGGAAAAASPLELKGADVVTDKAAPGAVVPGAAAGGRRRRRTGRKSHRRSRKVFGLF